ncbi:MAG TPA: ABC transporter ATP-binding protein [Thermoplasmata archaeon]|jgi:ABC-2 type transport system ATP-binding protein
MASMAIHVAGLKKRFAGFRHPVDALAGVDFEVTRGDIFGFLGPNGAGKTTTLRILATVLTPSAGTAEVDGHDILREPMSVRGAVGYMPEKPGAYPLLTGLQNLVYWGHLQDMDGSNLRERAKALLAELGLEEAADRKVKTYSHGMSKRLLMAQALIHDPPILLLDEPAGGLDPQGIRFFRDLVKKLQGEGKTLFLSSHILSEVEQTCTTVGIIHRGKMLAVDKMDALRHRIGASALTRVDVECDIPSQPVVQQLMAIPKVRMVYQLPNGIRVEGESGADVADEVTRVLVTNRVRIRAVKPAEPTLEDAFMSVLGGGQP